MRKIKINIGPVSLLAELNDSPTSDNFVSLLPLDIEMSRWGEEYYGDCGIEAVAAEDAKTVMEIDELAIWPIGQAFCIFFGPTPLSVTDAPVAASSVNPIGKIVDNMATLKTLGQEIKVKIEEVR
ncbi:MAG TPA: cyclophilin-like fold protein [Thermodesulfovibrionia bacterium]|nr:cyclophilin-like fold protein [Thermodesulfovibrionia bacterium]